MTSEPNGERDKDALKETAAQPDVGSDRGTPAQIDEPGRAPDVRRRPPLEIKEIEELEDDAPGG
jgi:hypothetical protein